MREAPGCSKTRSPKYLRYLRTSTSRVTDLHRDAIVEGETLAERMKDQRAATQPRPGYRPAGRGSAR